jgi:hypothetical protein
MADKIEALFLRKWTTDNSGFRGDTKYSDEPHFLTIPAFKFEATNNNAHED